MQIHKRLPYLPLLASMSTAYPRNSQEPLVQPSSSRRIVIRTTSESISGSYGLYDLLSISTQSGSISISVTPHSASPEDPQPASLRLSTGSGSVHASLMNAITEHRISADGVPSEPPPSYSSIFGGESKLGNAATQPGVYERNYTTSVSAQTGSISGSFPLGLNTALESHSGSLSGVELVVMPTNASAPRWLSTATQSGSQSVRIVERYSLAGKKGGWGLSSTHDSHSGSINIAYPDSWEGTIEVETGSGSTSITGRGVEIIRKSEGRVVARKGDEGSGKVVARTESGSVNLRFG